jgi:cytochrome d ubiquinol oxidase subunit I
MEITPLLLSRLQFAFTISFHIIFPSFTIGLAAWLSVLEALHVVTQRPVYRRLFQLWLHIFAVAFGLGVVSGIIMAFQFGTNWSVLSQRSGPIQGPLLAYESFTAFAVEASFFGVLMFGRGRVPRWFYLFSTVMVAFATTLSAFWIMCNNSWMQAPIGHIAEGRAFAPADWWSIVLSPVQWVRFPHMLLAAYITGAFCVAATGAWYMLRGIYLAEARVMLRMGLVVGAVLVPVQLFFGHLTGDYVHEWQPAKFAAIAGRWHDEQPASEVLFAIPDASAEKNVLEIKVPVLGSLIASMSFDSKEVGLTDFPRADRPPVLIPFFTFRTMVACGMALLLVAWVGSLLLLNQRVERSRTWLRLVFLSFPLPFIATLSGW